VKKTGEEISSSPELVPTGEGSQDKEASLPLLTEQEKTTLQSVIFKHFPVLEENLRLFDGPLTFLVRDLSRSLPTKKEFNQFMLIVVSWLQKINYFQANHRLNAYRVSRSEEVARFFFGYYNKAAMTLRELNCFDTKPLNHSNRLSNLRGVTYGLFVFVPLDVYRFHELIVNFIDSYDEMIKCVLFYSSKYNYFYFMFTMNHCSYSDRLYSAIATCELTSSSNISEPPTLYTSNEEINEQLFQSMHELVFQIHFFVASILMFYLCRTL
jgi:hypothetical protein